MHFADRLNEAIQKKNSVVCVGLDPRLDRLPAFILNEAFKEHGENFTGVANAFVTFCKGIIDSVHELAPAVKPQSAFFEQYGFQGVWAYEEICKYAREKGLIVIADAKRNDIGSTAKAYATAFLGKSEVMGESHSALEADAVTVTPYLGWDGVEPFMEACAENEKGIFVLVRTSNDSAGDLQDRITQGEEMPVHELMGHFVEAWGSEDLGESGYSFVGAVVGATYPGEAKKLREIMPKTIFLVPGYGAQGGGAEDVRPCFNEDGLGAIVNSSRGIIFAYENHGKDKEGRDYADCARDAVIDMNAALNKVRS